MSRTFLCAYDIISTNKYANAARLSSAFLLRFKFRSYIVFLFEGYRSPGVLACCPLPVGSAPPDAIVAVELAVVVGRCGLSGVKAEGAGMLISRKRTERVREWQWRWEHQRGRCVLERVGRIVEVG